jgi:cytochrome c553
MSSLQVRGVVSSFPFVRLAGVAILAALAGCGGGADVEEQPIVDVPPGQAYTGPAPATTDVQAFRINLWENVTPTNRCGACHGAGGQTPMFARTDDVNLAYADANTVVDLSSPGDSRMVVKVEGGHNCWLTDDAACGDILTTWITGWAGEAAGGGREIALEAPPIRDPGASRSFPDDSSLFAATVYPIVTTYCSRCHDSAAAIPQSPYFAAADVDAAYEAAKAKIDLDAPADSRLVVRLRDEFHNCWDDCEDNADEMQDAIEDFAAQIPVTEIDPSLVTSKALSLVDGIVASGGNRYEANVIALWEFKTGTGRTAFDTSGVEPALNLTFSGTVNWVGGWGIEIVSGKAQGSTGASAKLHRLISATGEYSIEAWVVPANVTQEDARIVSYSAGTTARNFTLGQTLYTYTFANRSDATDANGEPALATSDEDEDLQATLQHVVATFDPVNGRRLYVNGVFTDDVDPDGGGSLGDWDDTFAFVLGNEVSGDRQWQGTLRLVAIHNRALTPEQITQNFEAGVGEKFYLLFAVGHLIDVPDGYVMFEVSQFDSYSYLFNAPVFISLDPDARPNGIPLKGMRIGVNGEEAAVGQAYRTLDVMLDESDYGDLGQPLSDVGTVIALEKGPEADEFFLTFDVLGAHTNVRTDPVPIDPGPPADLEPQPDVGLRTFDEIAASMAAITGVSQQNPAVAATYATIRQQLPTVESIDGFLASHQVAVAQLAIEYCNELVDDTGLRASWFPGFNFAAPAAQAFDTDAERDSVIDPLLTRMLGAGLATQPADIDVRAEIHDLMDRLTACGNACEADRTTTVVKASCAAVLGSGTTLIQ